MSTTPISRKLMRLTATYTMTQIEAAVVQEFLAVHHLTTINRILAPLAGYQDSTLEELRKEMRSILPNLDLDAALHVFEMAIPGRDKDLNGAIYTPRHITDYICAKALVRGDETTIDPSCGAGAFLIAAVRRLRSLSGRSVSEIITQQLYGRDILDYSIRHARILLALMALEAGEDNEEIPDNLAAGDSLSPEWRKELIDRGGLDAVVGNPPYIRFQELPSEVREHLSTKSWQTTGAGNFNLYIAFFELGLEILNENGVLGYITPNAYFSTRSARGLRELLRKGEHLREIIDCGTISVFEVATYTAITFLNKSASPHFLFARPDTESQQFHLDDLPRFQFASATLPDEHWLLGMGDEVSVLSGIEKVGKPLSEIASLGVGLATLRDWVFLVRNPVLVTLDGTGLDKGCGECYRVEYEGKVFAIEKGITRPVIRVSDHPSQASMDQVETRVIFPYQEDSAGRPKVLGEETLRDTYPGAYWYFLAMKDELAERDHGKKTYDAWYAYGRRQGLVLPGQGQLLTTIYAARPRFLIDVAPGHLFVNGYAVIPKLTIKGAGKSVETSEAKPGLGVLWGTPEGLRALARILESDAMAVYVGLTSAPLAGGFRCYAGNYIANFGIPNVTSDQIATLANMTNSEAGVWYCQQAGLDPQVVSAMAKRFLPAKP